MTHPDQIGPHRASRCGRSTRNRCDLGFGRYIDTIARPLWLFGIHAAIRRSPNKPHKAILYSGLYQRVSASLVDCLALKHNLQLPVTKILAMN